MITVYFMKQKNVTNLQPYSLSTSYSVTIEVNAF